MVQLSLESYLELFGIGSFLFIFSWLPLKRKAQVPRQIQIQQLVIALMTRLMHGQDEYLFNSQVLFNIP